MPRRRTPRDIETTVLTKSRRRCCICYGLNRDTGIKQGQIAHLDQDASNSAESNLAFLCIPHHDQYDSQTRQSKNLTISEVKHYQTELFDALQKILESEVSFGEIKLNTQDFASGKYILPGEYSCAELIVSRLLDGRYHVAGSASYGLTREYGPNIGILDFISELENDTIVYIWEPSWNIHKEEDIYKAHFKFRAGKLDVSEENVYTTAIFGNKVSFTGEYNKVINPSK